ncbi:hypothetical protein VroAM7_03730 [Vibrio rotiferianus]|uniref:Uncharacterized protein n=1 Tax=Vibrio rotiferianus TaxID=190895 RepID=A0A510I5N0_9VIBR|nr:hypothetical protein VroAM7_03730 [Vibrio rotiferianus]
MRVESNFKQDATNQNKDRVRRYQERPNQNQWNKQAKNKVNNFTQNSGAECFFLFIERKEV